MSTITKVKVGGSIAEGLTAATLTTTAIPPALAGVPPLSVDLAALQVDPSMIIEGFPHADAGFGCSSHSALRATATAASGNPGPRTVNTKADGRFLPYTEYTKSARWWTVGRAYRTYPEMVLRKFHPKDVGPVVDPAYTWTYRGSRYAQPAFTFNGDGAMDLYTSAGTGHDTAATFLFAFVPHPGNASFWVLWANFSAAANAQMGLRFVQGRLDLLKDSQRAFSYQLRTAAGEACIVALTLDCPNNRGRLAVLDRRRGSVAFALGDYTSVDYHSRIGAGAALGGGLDLAHGSNFEMLEVDYWRHAVPDATLDGVMSNLAGVYGVAR